MLAAGLESPINVELLGPGKDPHCPKTSKRNFNLGVLNLYEIHFIALLNVKYPYPVSNVILHRI